MKLRTYLTDKKILSKQLAEVIGVSENYVNQLRAGHVRCSKRLAKSIQTFTNNEVTEKELFDEYTLYESEKREKIESKKNLKLETNETNI